MRRSIMYKRFFRWNVAVCAAVLAAVLASSQSSAGEASVGETGTQGKIVEPAARQPVTGQSEVLLVVPESAGPTDIRSRVEAIGGRVLVSVEGRVFWCRFPQGASFESLTAAGAEVASDLAAAELMAASSDDPMAAAIADAFAKTVRDGRPVQAASPGELPFDDSLEQPPLDVEAYLQNLRSVGLDPKDPEVAALLDPQVPGGGTRGNSDNMTGTVTLVQMFVESDGSIDANLYTWTAAHRNTIIGHTASGLAWWANMARGCGIALSFNYRVSTFQHSAFNTGYEPILHPAIPDQQLWINRIMANLGYSSGNLFDRVTAYNTWARGNWGTDWAYVAFVCYNPPPAATRFTDGRFAYAYLGGPFLQMLYRNDGWSIPDFARIHSHETGHIFRACDEYASSGCGCGLCSHGTNNLNCANGCGTEPCIMKSNSLALCDYTPRHIGWGTCSADDCEDAAEVPVPGNVFGDTSLATIDDAPFCGTGVTSPGVWYRVIGTGRTLTATTCSEFSSHPDTKISIYCNDCTDLVCVAGNDDNCSSFGGLDSTVSWCSEAGREYLILVHGFGGAVGGFHLIIYQGNTCGNPTSCDPCGDGVCNAQGGENCNTCPEDCGCDSCMRCVGGACVSDCGNGTCQTNCNENCGTCPQDCGCGSCAHCSDGACVDDCGNGTCQSSCGENCSTCPQDCGCGSCMRCVGGACVSDCGDGTCQANCGETCSTCPQDCGCGSCMRCVGGACVSDCGDGTCQANCGENCSTCPQDCGCGSCSDCVNGSCVGDCGNGTCQPNCGENCSTCAQDCGCGSCSDCVNGSCVGDCGNGQCQPACGETCSTCAQDCGCGPCENCVGGACVGPCGDGVCDAGCDEDCSTCPADCGTCGGTCEDCGPGPHWIDNPLCSAGVDSIPDSGATVGIDLNFDCLADTSLRLHGPTTIVRSSPMDDSAQFPGIRPVDGHLDVIDTEIVSMVLTNADGVVMTAGDGLGAIPLRPTLGVIAEQPGAPEAAESFFAVFFEVNDGGGMRLYNQIPLIVASELLCVPPDADYIHPPECVPLWTSPNVGQGVLVGNLVVADHDTVLDCGSVTAGNCRESNSTPYCNDIPCCENVCAELPQCCNENWGPACAARAQALCGECGFTIGGAVYEDCDSPITSGVPGVPVTVTGTGGTFNATTVGAQGLWVIPDVPCGLYLVVPDTAACHVSGDCPPDPCNDATTIIVDAANQAQNQSIQFWGCAHTIGGAIYDDCDSPITSGVAGITVSVVGAEGTFSATTAGAQGIWSIPNVPCGTYTVTPMETACHVSGDCPPDPCNESTSIVVNSANQGVNQSIQFYTACMLYDMNNDGFTSIIGDVPCFVDCIYFGECSCCENWCTCAADCNCDGFTSIIGDVPCFVDCVYFGSCGGCGRSSDSGGGGDGFTVGGAVYGDERNPLVSGVGGVRVNLLDADGRRVGSTTTAGLMGIWRIDNVPQGAYVVVFGSASDAPSRGDAIKIVVNSGNEAANQSITLLQTPEASEPEGGQDAAATAKTERSRSK